MRSRNAAAAAEAPQTRPEGALTRARALPPHLPLARTQAAVPPFIPGEDLSADASEGAQGGRGAGGGSSSLHFQVPEIDFKMDLPKIDWAPLAERLPKVELPRFAGFGGLAALGGGAAGGWETDGGRLTEADRLALQSDTQWVNDQVCVPSPTLSPTDPVPRGLLTLCPGASSGPQGLYTAYIQHSHSLYTLPLAPSGIAP